MLRDSGATVLVFDGEHDTVVADLRDRGGTDDATPVVHWVRVGANGPPWALDFDALVQEAPADPVSVDVDGDHPLFIMYTSGTTGLPKGALHTHDSVQWSVLTVLASVDVRFRDRYLICNAAVSRRGAQPDGLLYLSRRDHRHVAPVRREADLGGVPRRAGHHHAGRRRDAELHAAHLSARTARVVAAALDHEWRGAGAPVVDRVLRPPRLRGPPGLRAHRDMRSGVRDQPRRGAVPHRVDRQGVLPHRRAHRRPAGR